MKDLLVINDPQECSENTNDLEHELIDMLPKRALKNGLRLPKSKREWETANNYFNIHIDYLTPINNVENDINNLNELVYNYFCDNHGESSVPTNNANLQAKYGDA